MQLPGHPRVRLPNTIIWTLLGSLFGSHVFDVVSQGRLGQSQR